MDPLTTAAATASQVKSILKLLPEEQGTPKFGSARNPEAEKQCPYIDVFMSSMGRTNSTTERRVYRLPPDATPLDAKSAFAAESCWGGVPQEDIADENNFVLSNDLLKEPLYSLSCGCRLNLHFLYRTNLVAKELGKASSSVTSAGTSVKDAVTSVKDAWSSILGKNEDSGGSSSDGNNST